MYGTITNKGVNMDVKKFESILDEAKEITGNNRMEAYGHPKHNFKDIAIMWKSYIQMKHDSIVNIDAKDVAFMMVLFKICREKSCHKRDNLVDGAGYMRNAAQIEDIE